MYIDKLEKAALFQPRFPPFQETGYSSNITQFDLRLNSDSVAFFFNHLQLRVDAIHLFLLTFCKKRVEMLEKELEKSKKMWYCLMNK